MEKQESMAHNCCPICSNASVSALINQNEFPYFTVPVSKKGKEEILSKYDNNQLIAPLKIKVCGVCCHAFLSPLPNQEIVNFLYSNYYSYPSPLKSGIEPERDNRFLEFFQHEAQSICSQKNLNSILEIGCYDGYILHHLGKKGFNVTGCDPSNGSEIGIKQGINIIREFFDPDDFLKRDQYFDIIISRHYIEHTADPRSWIKNLKKILSPGGILIIEAPNVSFYLKNGLLEVFSLQHLQGFSKNSLNYALVNEGLNTLIMKETPDNLIVVAEEGRAPESEFEDNWNSLIDQFDSRLRNNKTKLQETIRHYVSNKKRICLWGAGGFGLIALLLYGVPANKIDFIVDSDSDKWDMEYLNFAIPIISPKDALELSPDLIIITSMYSQSIKKQIERTGFYSSVLNIFPKVDYFKGRGH